MRRYNATTNVWTLRADIPDGSEAPAGAFFGGKIYVADGVGGANLIRIYDIATNTWSAGPVRPGVTSSYGAAAGAFNGDVYVVGGNNAAPSAIVSIYNIATNSWSAGPPAPSSYRLGGYTQIGQFLYLIGSFTSTASVNTTVSMRLDMATNTWSTGPVWTPQRADFALAAAGTKLIAIGGDSNGGSSFNASAQVDELDTSTWPGGAWVPSPDNLPSARQANQAGFVSIGRVGGEIWSTGGIAPPGNVFLNEHLFRAAPTCASYTFTTSAGDIVPGTVDTGNHTNDGSTVIAIPFSYQLYDQVFATVKVGSNGHLTFGTVNNAFNPTCIPIVTATYAIGPYWTDQCTGACTGVSGAGLGIFTSVSGVAPNRIFNIEWRTAYFNSGGAGVPLNYEVRLYEGQASFDIIYGKMTTFTPPASRNLSVGVQKNNNAGQFTLEGCDPAPTGGSNPPVGTAQLYHYTLTSTTCATPPAQTGFLYALNDNTVGNQIYAFSVNETTGLLTLLAGFPLATGGNGAGGASSEHLALDSVNQRLYAINDGSDSVSAYSIDPTTGGLTPLPFSPISLGAKTWQVAVHPAGSPLVVGDGFVGQARSYTITATTVTQAAGSPFTTGSARPFSSVFSRDGAFYYAGGSSGTTFAGFSVNTTNGVLTALAGSAFNSGAANPLAYATDSQGRFFTANFATSLRVFTTAAGVPSPATGNPFASGLTQAVDGVLHPNERFYLVADRGGNQFGSYKVNGSGAATTLAPVTGSPFASGGTFTDALVMNQTGAFLYGANGNSRNLTRYDVSSNTGILTNPTVQAADTLGAAGRLTGIAYTNSALVRTAVSRKIHSTAGIFDVNLPLTGTPGIECRRPIGADDYQILVTFATPVTISAASVTSGIGSVDSFSVSGGVVTVNLNGVANAQTLTLSLDVSDGVNTSNVAIPISFLLGDTSGNGSVNASDIGQTKAQSGQPVTGANFRTDVTSNSQINASDVSLVKSGAGTFLP